MIKNRVCCLQEIPELNGSFLDGNTWYLEEEHCQLNSLPLTMFISDANHYIFNVVQSCIITTTIYCVLEVITFVFSLHLCFNYNCVLITFVFLLHVFFKNIFFGYHWRLPKAVGTRAIFIVSFFRQTPPQQILFD